MWLFWIDCKNPCRLYVDIVVRCGACQLVHSTIGLREWIEKRPNLSSSLHCELCRRPYSIRLTKRIAWTRRNLCRCQPCGYLAEAFVLLLGLIVLGVSLVEIIRMMKKKSKKRKREETANGKELVVDKKKLKKDKSKDVNKRKKEKCECYNS